MLAKLDAIDAEQVDRQRSTQLPAVQASDGDRHRRISVPLVARAAQSARGHSGRELAGRCAPLRRRSRTTRTGSPGCEAFPAYMDQTIELMRRGIDERIVQPKVVMQPRAGPDPAADRRGTRREPVLQAAEEVSRRHLASRSGAAEERPRQRRSRTASFPRTASSHKFFDEEYLPACFDEVGAWQLPRGEEFYALRCRVFTTTKLTPDEIHEIGLKEVARIRAEMEAIVRRRSASRARSSSSSTTCGPTSSSTTRRPRSC